MIYNPFLDWPLIELRWEMPCAVLLFSSPSCELNWILAWYVEVPITQRQRERECEREREREGGKRGWQEVWWRRREQVGALTIKTDSHQIELNIQSIQPSPFCVSSRIQASRHPSHCTTGCYLVLSSKEFSILPLSFTQITMFNPPTSWHGHGCLSQGWQCALCLCIKYSNKR